MPCPEFDFVCGQSICVIDNQFPISVDVFRVNRASQKGNVPQNHLWVHTQNVANTLVDIWILDTPVRVIDTLVDHPRDVRRDAAEALVTLTKRLLLLELQSNVADDDHTAPLTFPLYRRCRNLGLKSRPVDPQPFHGEFKRAVDFRGLFRLQLADQIPVIRVHKINRRHANHGLSGL